jgi:hypothetical protein
MRDFQDFMTFVTGVAIGGLVVYKRKEIMEFMNKCNQTAKSCAYNVRCGVADKTYACANGLEKFANKVDVKLPTSLDDNTTSVFDVDSEFNSFHDENVNLNSNNYNKNKVVKTVNNLPAKIDDKK